MSATDDETTAPSTLEELYLTPVAAALIRGGYQVSEGGAVPPHYLIVRAAGRAPRAITVHWHMVTSTRWEYRVACLDSLGDFHPRETSIVKGQGDGTDSIPRLAADIVRRVDEWFHPVLRSVR